MLPDHLMAGMLTSAGYAGIRHMQDQLEVATEVPWGTERHELAPRYALACLGKLDRLARELEAVSEKQPILAFQSWSEHHRLFEGIVRDLVQRAMTYRPDYSLTAAELQSEDARCGIELVVSGEVATLPETRLLLKHLPQIRPDLVPEPAPVG